MAVFAGATTNQLRAKETCFFFRIGTRIPRMYKENITEPEILASLDELIGRWAKEREAGEGFGDFTVRAGIIRPVLDPARDLWD
jgi:sulfite reductase (NADPH) hemoprotein beta-component